MLHPPCGLDALEMLAVAAATAAQHDYGLARIVSRSPKKIIVMRADGVRQSVLWSEEIYRSSFSPAIREDSGLGTFFGRQAVIDTCHLFHHLFPPEFVGKILRQRSV